MLIKLQLRTKLRQYRYGNVYKHWSRDHSRTCKMLSIFHHFVYIIH